MKHNCMLENAHLVTEPSAQLDLLAEYLNHRRYVPEFWRIRNSVSGEDPVVHAWKSCRQPKAKAFILEQLRRYDDKEFLARAYVHMRAMLLHVPIFDRETMSWKTELVFLDTGETYTVETAMTRFEAAIRNIAPPTYPDIWAVQAAYLPITGMVN